MNQIRLPPLPYGFRDLAPAINEQSVRRHYFDNHAGYVKKYNALVAEDPVWRDRTFADVLQHAAMNTPLYNNAAQAWAHEFWWKSMTPRQFMPPAFIDYDRFVEGWLKEGKALFGSGWLWLVVDARGELVIEALPNAILPQRAGKLPILVMDLWEHAYYCQYGTDREKFLRETLPHLNWPVVEQRYRNISR